MGTAPFVPITANIAKIQWAAFHAYRCTSTITERAKSAWINAAAATLRTNAFNVITITSFRVTPPRALRVPAKQGCYAST